MTIAQRETVSNLASWSTQLLCEEVPCGKTDWVVYTGQDNYTGAGSFGKFVSMILPNGDIHTTVTNHDLAR